MVLACSALKEKYRSFLLKEQPIPLHFILLEASKAIISERMKARAHFMPVTLLDSQFDALEKASYGSNINIAYSLEKNISQLKKS